MFDIGEGNFFYDYTCKYMCAHACLSYVCKAQYVLEPKQMLQKWLEYG